ncbi:MAG: radical SAM protein [Candidatus Rokuibacteriota bacterium]
MATTRVATTEHLRGRLAELTVPGRLVTAAADGRLECTACAYRCRLLDGATGLCGVRQRRGSVLRVPFGYVAAWRIMPVERNTIYHLRPGRLSLTFGMLGCDLRCPWCSNAALSQALRDEEVAPPPLEPVSAEALVARARRAGCGVVVSAFNEPMITAEWAYAIFSEARRHRLATALVSDGNTTSEALEFLRPVTDVFRVDIKGTEPAHYEVTGGVAEAPLAALRRARALGYWVEAVTMVVPGVNDAPAGLDRLARELARIDPELPWHLNAFVPRHRMRDRPAQDPGPLVSAAGSAYARGLHHVYVGNVADRVRGLSHTRCPDCHEVVVSRSNYATQAVTLREDRCPRCGRSIAGRWT